MSTVSPDCAIFPAVVSGLLSEVCWLSLGLASLTSTGSQQGQLSYSYFVDRAILETSHPWKFRVDNSRAEVPRQGLQENPSQLPDVTHKVLLD